MSSVIEIENLKKYFRYGIRGIGIIALDGISFSVEDGEVFGLLGPNGAGKSTTIKIILGLLRQNSGTCKVFGSPIGRRTKASIGYLPESPYFYKFLTGFELVTFYARLCGMGKSEAKTAAMNAINLVGLDEAADRPLSLYSKGMTQRAGLAQAVVHNPKLVILNEPASGLDPIGASDMADIIIRLRDSGKTVLLCSHMMSEVEKLCSRAAILSRGKVVSTGRIDDMLTQKNREIFEVENAPASMREDVSRLAESNGAKLVSACPARISLDEYFRKTVERNK